MATTLNQLLSTLPPDNDRQLLSVIRQRRAEARQTIVVLDDDPTGTQTVYDLPVLTEWTTEVIATEFTQETPVFYILTNSRSLPATEANQLARTIGANLLAASQQTGRGFFVISRSDSTLRGHYPNEVDALLEGMNQPEAIRLIIPAFFAGGRYTIGDVHYVQEGEQLIPAAETPFAQDRSFGFVSSNLRDWVEEKTEGKVKAEEVLSFNLARLRAEGPSYVTQQLLQCPPASTAVVNAASRHDLEIFALGLLEANVPVLCRTAASFVPAIAGLPPRPLLSQSDLALKNMNGGLVVVGSYVPKSTAQLAHLLKHGTVQAIELSVKEVLETKDTSALAQRLAEQADTSLKSGKDTVIYTSRELITGKSKEQNLAIGRQVSDCLTGVVAQLSARPRYVLAKGGITSSDTATQALHVKKAQVAGQIRAGVSVWQLGDESKFPGLSYIVFPGNVGEENTLAQVVHQLQANA